MFTVHLHVSKTGVHFPDHALGLRSTTRLQFARDLLSVYNTHEASSLGGNKHSARIERLVAEGTMAEDSIKTQIAIINSSSVVKDEEIIRTLPSLQKQISRDFAPCWGVDARLSFASNRDRAKGCWWLVIVDNSDQAGVLGYHDLTADGLPMGTVFAGRDKLVGAH